MFRVTPVQNMFVFVHVYKVTHCIRNSELGQNILLYICSNRVVVTLVKNMLAVTEPVGSFLCCQNPATCPYPESGACSSQPPTQYL
jgi:hypothetical protein